jgi:hypothetical protein
LELSAKLFTRAFDLSTPELFGFIVSMDVLFTDGTRMLDLRLPFSLEAEIDDELAYDRSVVRWQRPCVRVLVGRRSDLRQPRSAAVNLLFDADVGGRAYVSDLSLVLRPSASARATAARCEFTALSDRANSSSVLTLTSAAAVSAMPLVSDDTSELVDWRLPTLQLHALRRASADGAAVHGALDVTLVTVTSVDRFDRVLVRCSRVDARCVCVSVSV